MPTAKWTWISTGPPTYILEFGSLHPSARVDRVKDGWAWCATAADLKYASGHEASCDAAKAAAEAFITGQTATAPQDTQEKTA